MYDGEEAIPSDPLCDRGIMKCRVGVPVNFVAYKYDYTV